MRGRPPGDFECITPRRQLAAAQDGVRTVPAQQYAYRQGLQVGDFVQCGNDCRIHYLLLVFRGASYSVIRILNPS
jgi:hypothetical protein